MNSPGYYNSGKYAVILLIILSAKLLYRSVLSYFSNYFFHNLSDIMYLIKITPNFIHLSSKQQSVQLAG